MIGAELLRFKKEQKYLAYDCETASLCLTNSSLNRAWQNGWGLYKGKELVSMHEDWLLWDGEWKMGDGAAKITGFTWGEYRQRAKPVRPLWEEFERHLYDPETINIGANTFGFDSHIVQLNRELLGKPRDYSFLRRAICVQVLQKAIVLKIAPPPFETDEWLSFCFKLQNYRQKGLKTNLAFLAKEYGVECLSEMQHKAEYDLRLTKAIFDKQLYLIDI